MPGVLGSLRSMLSTGRKAASVLPVAVGEIKRTFLPSRILGMVFSCGSVGLENPFCSTSLRTGFTSMSKAFSEVDCNIRGTSNGKLRNCSAIKNVRGFFGDLQVF